MLGIRITYSHGGSVPPSPEVLRQGVRRTADRTGLAVEHVWASTDARWCHVVLFLVGEDVAEAVAACLALARTLEASTAGIRFLRCSPVLS